MQVLQIAKNSSVTQKGQVTIPANLRNKLGITPGARVSFEAGKDHIKLRPIRHTLENVFMSAGPLKKKLSLKEIRKIALEDKITKKLHKTE